MAGKITESKAEDMETGKVLKFVMTCYQNEAKDIVGYDIESPGIPEMEPLSILGSENPMEAIEQMLASIRGKSRRGEGGGLA